MNDTPRKRRLKPRTVCHRCEGFMQRKTTISERPQNRHWGDSDPFLSLGQVDIHHFICVACGNVAAYQVKAEARTPPETASS